MRRLFQRQKAPLSDKGDTPERSTATTALSPKIFPSGIKLLYSPDDAIFE
jgi:hypothetical protein